MRLSLEHLDMRGLEIRSPEGEPAQRIRARSATGLRGQAEQSPQRLSLTGLQADAIVLDALRLALGELLLTEEQEAELRGLRGSFEQAGSRTSLDLEAVSVDAGHLRIEVGSVRVRGEARIEGMRLWTRDADGGIEAERVHVRSFRLEIGETALAAPELEASRLRIGWGEGGFRLDADTLDGAAAELSVGGLRVGASGLTVRGLALHDSDVSVGSAALASATVDMGFGAESASPPPSSPAPAPEIDWHLLDRLSGEVNVDLHVDLTVPVIGRRRATHRFRVPITCGTLDYIRLENDLSTLENTLLDFAVRDDGTLVLERGIPLLPTRGRGKPILVWDLNREDLELARRQQVRLAVLPRFRVAGEADEGREASGSSIALRRLSLHDLAVRLALEAIDTPMEGMLRRLAVASLTLQGHVHHEPDGTPPQGRLRGRLEGLEAGLQQLAVGDAHLSVERARIGQLKNLQLNLHGLKPARLQLELGEVALEQLRFG